MTSHDKSRDLQARLLATFHVEAEEHLDVMARHLSALERGLPPEAQRDAVEATFRAMHTLKGAARTVGLLEIEAACQEAESVLSRVARGQTALTAETLAMLQETVDAMTRRIAGSQGSGGSQRSGGPGAQGDVHAPMVGDRPPAAAAVPPRGGETIRVATARLDALFARAEDLLGAKLSLAARAAEARSLTAATAAAPSIEGQARELWRRLDQDRRSLTTAVDALLEELRLTRMTPAAAVVELLPRMARELAAEQGKDVECVIDGGEMEVDRKVLEVTKDALMHLVRNAVDHGIEPPEARARAGKPRRGRVAITVAPLEGHRVEMRVEDDGRGIDAPLVRSQAVRAGLFAPEDADALSDEQVLQVIYRSGFTTSPIITDVSGHGLGLAIVKERVERLGGQIHLETRPGEGTVVRMTLPATIATFRGLLVRAGGQPFLLPIDAVERVIRVNLEDLDTVEGRRVLHVNGRPTEVARLASLVGRGETDDATSRAGAELDPPRADRGRPLRDSFDGGRRPSGLLRCCVILRAAEACAGLVVDEVAGDTEVLVKELGPPFVRVRHVAAAGLLGTGEVVLILRPADLAAAARERSAVRAAPPIRPRVERRRSILVVDDSITTRTMEKNLLEAAGYDVRVAVDGIDAWTLLKSEPFDLVVSDVDMPRLDGLELTARIRSEPALADLPVVLVTALESREDKERGIEVGANAYLVKSAFDQSNLLEIIRRLV